MCSSRGVGAVDDDLGCGLPVDGPVQLVLHRREEALGGLRRHVVVDRRGVDVGDLLVELALRQADLADALELLFEVAIAQDGAAALEALVVHREALDGELLDDARGPLAELHRALGVDLVADRDDGREVVVLGVVRLAVGGSYSKTSNNCVLLQLAVLEHLLQVVVDGRHLHVVELRHHLLAEPHVLVGVDRLHAPFAPLAATKVRYSAADERTRARSAGSSLAVRHARADRCCFS
jgi:hypothetical protein